MAQRAPDDDQRPRRHTAERAVDRLQLLFLACRVPWPLNRGDKVRTYGISRAMAREHDVTLVAFEEYEGELAAATPHLQHVTRSIGVPLPRLARYCHTLLAGLTIDPLQVAYYRSSAMRRAVGYLCGTHHFDVAYAFHLRMAETLHTVSASYKILDMCDAVSLFTRRMVPYVAAWKRPILMRETLALQRYEREAARMFDECWFCSPVDAQAIGRNESSAITSIVGPPMDLTLYQPGPPVHQPAMLFVGYMGDESVDTVLHFADDILPSIHEVVPDATFNIVGANPPPAVTALGTRPGIRVLGFLDDLPAALRSHRVLVAPMRFVAGVQTKIVEALACGLPVVTTMQGNEGIFAEPGTDILVADEPRAFAECAIRLLRDDHLYFRMSAAGRHFAVTHFSDTTVLARVREIQARLHASASCRE